MVKADEGEGEGEVLFLSLGFSFSLLSLGVSPSPRGWWYRMRGSGRVDGRAAAGSVRRGPTQARRGLRATRGRGGKGSAWSRWETPRRKLAVAAPRKPRAACVPSSHLSTAAPDASACDGLRGAAFGRCVPPLFLPTPAGLPVPWHLPSSALYFAVAPHRSTHLPGLFRVRSGV